MSTRSALINLSLKEQGPPSEESARLYQADLFLASITPRFPAFGMFDSALVHAAIATVLLYPPFFRSLSPPPIIERQWEATPLSPTDPEVMTEVSNAAHSALPAPALSAAAAQHKTTAAVQQTYSGPQEIVSQLPDATNAVQTIRLPDVVNPPKLKFPQLLKPVVILTPKAPPVPEVEAPAPVVDQSSTLHVQEVPVEHPKLAVASTAVMPPRLETQAQEIRSTIPSSESHSVIVLNAVTVPDNTPVMVPKAELSGSFVVHAAPSSPSNASAMASADPPAPAPIASSAASTTTSKATQPPKGAGVDSHSDAPAGNPNASVSIGSNSNGNHSSQAAGSPQGRENGTRGQTANGGSGIAIFGGTSRGEGRTRISSDTSARYGLTVISSGTSGGATRDLGVFDRSETVYTVFIPMADAGGGPDWSMQYAVVDPSPSAGGLLTPPVAVKKIRAVVSDSPGTSATVIFFSAVISAKGELTAKPLREMDARARQALDALWGWEFHPAQLNGVAVAVKALIGVPIGSR